MVFTEEDAENDGKIKAESSGKIMGVAKRESPEIFEHFEKVCDDKGVDPKTQIGDLLIRTLNSEDFADNVLQTEITLQKAKMDNIRLDDLEFIMTIKEKFGDGKQEKSKIEQLIEQRIDQSTSTPVSNFARNNDGKSNGQNNELVNELRELRQEVQEMKGGEEKPPEPEPVSVNARKTGEEMEQEIDDLMEDNDPEPSVEVEPDEEEEEAVSGDPEGFEYADEETEEAAKEIAREEEIARERREQERREVQEYGDKRKAFDAVEDPLNVEDGDSDSGGGEEDGEEGWNGIDDGDGENE